MRVSHVAGQIIDSLEYWTLNVVPLSGSINTSEAGISNKCKHGI